MSESMLERAALNVKAKVPQGYGMTDSEAIEYARTVIETIRDPSREMFAAALVALVPASDANACWRAMIDQILSETRKP